MLEPRELARLTCLQLADLGEGVWRCKQGREARQGAEIQCQLS